MSVQPWEWAALPVGVSHTAFDMGKEALGGGDKSGYSIPWDQYFQRLGQINSYESKLNAASTQYKGAINNLNATTYGLYMPAAAAAFAGRGLNIDSGAFGAELARTAAGLTASGLKDAYGQDISNIKSVEGERSSAWDQIFGAQNESNKAGWMNANQNQRAMGQFIGNAGFTALFGGSPVGLLGLNGGGNTPNPNSGSDHNYSDFRPSSPWSGSSEGW